MKGRGYRPRATTVITREDLGLGAPLPPETPSCSPFGTARREPSGGYAFSEKSLWRTAIWERIAASTPKPQRAAKQVFLIESLEGLEIAKALRLGFVEQNLHVCNATPAVVATLKRRHPLIHTYGVVADRALRKIADGPFKMDIVSLDFCACLSVRVVNTLRLVGPAGATHCVVAVNVLRGRESGPFAATDAADFMRRTRAWRRSVRPGAARAQVDGLEGLDRGRLAWITFSLAGFVDTATGIYDDVFVRQGDSVFIRAPKPGQATHKLMVNGTGLYRTGLQTMRWFVFSLLDVLEGVVDGEGRTWADVDGPHAPSVRPIARKANGMRV